MVLLSVLVVLTVTLLVSQRVRVEVVALGVIVALGLTGTLDPAEALSGFASPATLTVAAMLILSAGLERAGVVDYIGSAVARRAAGGATRALALLALPVALFSAFMNNTAVVALMIPVVLTIARRLKQPASRFLIPVSYLSILGGTCTLIGTSTNLLVDSLYRQSGGPGFGIFEFSGLGLLYLLIGGGYVVFVAPRLLPARTALASLMAGTDPEMFVTEVRIPAASPLVGKRLQGFVGDALEIRVLELIRGEEAVLGPPRETVLEAGDHLLVEGTARRIHELIRQRRVEQGTAVSDTEREPIRRLDLSMVEAVITPGSRFLHRKVQDLGLSRRLGILVLAVRRLGRHHHYNLRAMQLLPGDVLLLQGERDALRGLQDDGDVLLVEGVEQTLTFPHRAPTALGILLGVVGLAAANVAPLVFLAIAGVAAMLLTGCLTLPRATRALDPSVLLLLAGMLPLGLAMEKTGLAALIAESVLDVAGSHGPVLLIATFYVLASVLTEILSNNAAAVLLTPIGLGIAAQLGMDPKPLLVAVMFGSSASFATPIGYQTNLMVMGPGGYLFRDYLRVGLPMNILGAIAATVLIPWFWPL